MAEVRTRIEDAASGGNYARIVDSGLFDAEFYLATYGPLAADEDPLRHFLSVGLDQGRQPSAQFDPALYRLVYPECGDANPLLHHLDCGTAVPDPAEHLSELVAACQQAWPKPRNSKPAQGNGKGPQSQKKGPSAPKNAPRPSDADLDLYEQYAEEVAQRQCFEVAISDAAYRIRSLEPPEILGRLASGEPFAFARLPHGYWDALCARDAVAGSPMLSGLKPGERLAIASRAGALAKPRNGVFADAFLDEVPGIARAHAGDPYFLRAVAFRGHPKPDKGLFAPFYSQEEIDQRLRHFSRCFAPEDEIYDATMWKRFSLSGDLEKLPDACRDSHVVLLGPDYLADLGSRWANTHYDFIEIEKQRTHYKRYALLARVKQTLAAIADSTSRPVVLFTQCGGSLAFWLIGHLYAWRRDMSYVDLGQSVNIWFGDREDLPRYPWFQVYSALSERR